MSKAHASIILGLLASNSNPNMHAAVVSRNLQRERVSNMIHLNTVLIIPTYLPNNA